jgi:hypothetical protein
MAAPPVRVRSTVKLDFFDLDNADMRNIYENPQAVGPHHEFTDVSVMFLGKRLEQHLKDAGIVLGKSDQTHARPIFPVKFDEQATGSKLFAVYRVCASL